MADWPSIAADSQAVVAAQIAAALAPVNAAAAALGTTVGTQGARITALEGQVSTLSGLVDEQAGTIASQAAQLLDHEARIAELEGATVPPPPPPPPSAYPTPTKPLTLGKPPATLARPAYLASVPDGTFQGRIKRISDVAGLRNPYAKSQAWSKGDAYIALWFIPKSSVGWKVVKTSDWSQLPMPTGVDWCSWSNLDPTLMYGVSYSTGAVKKWRIGDAGWTTVRTFTGYTSVKFEEGSLSSDDGMPLVGDGKDAWAYWPAQDKVSPKVMLGSGILDAQMAWSGQYLLTCQNSATGAKLWSTSTGAQLAGFVAPADAHNCMARDLVGNDVYVHLTGASPEMYRLNGTKVILAPQPPKTLWSGGERGHVSAHNNEGRPGYVTLSSNDNTPSANDPGWDEILTLKLDGSGEYERFCHARSTPSTAAAGAYDATPYAQSSRDGTRILFGSTWTNDTAVTPVHAYVTGLAV